MAESKGELKSLLMKVKEEKEKADLKPNIQKTKIMTSSPIISWGENGSSDRAYFLQLQNHCGQWLQPWNEKTLAPWKKNYNKPRHCITMQRHHFANKSLYSQSYGFSSESLAIKKAEWQRIDIFELWCWRRLLRVPWTVRRSNQST